MAAFASLYMIESPAKLLLILSLSTESCRPAADSANHKSNGVARTHVTVSARLLMSRYCDPIADIVNRFARAGYVKSNSRSRLDGREPAPFSLVCSDLQHSRRDRRGVGAPKQTNGR